MKLNEKLNKKDIITAGLSRDYVVSGGTGYKILTLDKEIAKIGNKLSLSNGSIVIGDGVKHILISAQMMMVLGPTSTPKNICVYKNGSEFLTNMNNQQPVNSNLSKSISPQLVEVEEGDTFTLAIYGANGDDVSAYSGRTYITIEVIN